MKDTSEIEIIFINPYTTEELLSYLVKWTARLNEQRFSKAETEESAV